MAKKQEMIITPFCGERFFVDTSEKSCEKFGFRPGDRVETKRGKRGTGRFWNKSENRKTRSSLDPV